MTHKCTSINHTQALILSPTRELSQQTKNVIDSIGKLYKNLRTQLLIGGTSTEKDIHSLNSNPPHVVIGCPGRVHDMIRRKYYSIIMIPCHFFKILIWWDENDMNVES